jgi:hypothetical protein
MCGGEQKLARRKRIFMMTFALCAGICSFDFLAFGFENLILKNTN